ncbi:MAG: Pantothenate synthetase [Steroidobacteraceae bacterium]|nr:Pantothenate synthetase [Steroidobacteraceae bacterium]
MCAPSGTAATPAGSTASPDTMQTVTHIADVRARVLAWRRAGERIAFVPTMGNLHAGHISLIELARRHGGRFIASIFVNPMQFGPNEDFTHYPRTPARDAEMLAAAGCDLMFMPDVGEMYAQGATPPTRVEVPEISTMLCGAFRPGHFDGVATVVAKLFNIVQPDVAIFGEKDFQQLVVIRRMAADLCFPITIIGAPTVREPDGLAMSSRNQYLAEAERAVAPAIHAALAEAASALATGAADLAALEHAGAARLAAQGMQVDYFTVRRRLDLEPPVPADRELVVLAAARLGKARLIDNLQVDRSAT